MLIGSSTAVQRIRRLYAEPSTHRNRKTEDIRKYTPSPSASSNGSPRNSSGSGRTWTTPSPHYRTSSQHLKTPRHPTNRKSDSRGKDLFTLTEIIAGNLPDDLKRSDSVYISAFQDLVLEYSSLASADIYSFLAWWDSTGRKRAISSAPSVDAIRVMTIHKSKGLEFPCVHIPLVHGSLVKGRGC